jgi:hypothetical protein
MAKTAEKSTKAKKKGKEETVSPAPALSGTPRRLKPPKYKSFQMHRRIKGERLPGAFRLLGRSFATFGRHWKVFVGITVVYGLLNVILVQGFSAGGSLSDTKETLDEVFSGNMGQLASGLTLFVYLLSMSGNTVSPTAGAYQLILTLLISLALIWTLRQVYAGQKVRIRDGFYEGVAPLVKFILVLILIGIQLIPFAIGMLLYGTVTSNGIAATTFEQVLWALLLFMAAITSLYMVSSSIFGLYIVTLPDMTPIRALRSARQLVLNRRWAVLRKVVFLPIALVVLSGLLIIPLILFLTPIAAWVFFAVSMLLLPLIHGYMYALYRSLL